MFNGKNKIFLILAPSFYPRKVLHVFTLGYTALSFYPSKGSPCFYPIGYTASSFYPRLYSFKFLP